MKEKLWLIIRRGCLLTIIVAVSIMRGISLASPDQPTVSLEPKIVTAAPGEFFTLNVTVTNITPENSPPIGLCGWQINITFNPDVLNVSAAAEGPFLEQAGNTWWLPAVMNNDIGYVFLGDALFPMPLSPLKGAYGSGVLANVTFKVKTEGQTDLHFKEVDTWLNSYDESTGFTVRITHSTVDSEFKYPAVLRNVAITDVAVSSTSVLAGENVTINVTVKNMGNSFPETFNVSVSYDSNDIGMKTVTDLAVTASQIESFNWNTSGVAKGNYTITALATTVPDEYDTDDNSNSDVVVEVKEPSSTQFVLPIELLIAGIVAIVAIGVGAFFLIKRRSTKK